MENSIDAKDQFDHFSHRHLLSLVYLQQKNEKDNDEDEDRDEEAEDEFVEENLYGGECNMYTNQWRTKVTIFVKYVSVNLTLGSGSIIAPSVYEFLNIKFGGTLKIKSHPHRLTFVQGIGNNGKCFECGIQWSQGEVIFKCLECKFTLDYVATYAAANLLSKWCCLVHQFPAELHHFGIEITLKVICSSGPPDLVLLDKLRRIKWGLKSWWASQVDSENSQVKVKCRNSINVLHNIKSKLSENQLKIWNTTCFKDWLDVKCSIADTTLIRVMIQHEEVSTLDPKIFGMTYRVGGVELKFGPKEFCLLSGFRFGKQTCDFDSLGNSFHERVLKGKEYQAQQFSNLLWKRLFPIKVCSTMNEDDESHEEVACTSLVGEVTVDELNDEDVVRLFLLALVISFEGCQVTKKLDARLLNLVNDFEEWNRFPWGNYFWDNTFPHLHNLFERMPNGENKKKKIYYSINGFSWMWIPEVLPVCQIYTTSYKLTIPRSHSWGTVDKNKKKKKGVCYDAEKRDNQIINIIENMAETNNKMFGEILMRLDVGAKKGQK
ncbi:hypothetical protein E3N88_41061 [Mikania micrantha]|uniref:DUF1985 domain-containing protein n=1 Tax=Mikania micrantha TaxID=192012 RepID=A0A5N6LPH8_9ASTR|nr:hypothetical protein E3N88_41061 [Mikania micrantha]